MASGHWFRNSSSSTVGVWLKSIKTRHRSAACNRSRAKVIPADSNSPAPRLIPAVSARMMGQPSKAVSPVTTSRVVPGSLNTIDRWYPSRALMRLDFPTFGRPVSVTLHGVDRCNPKLAHTSRPSSSWWIDKRESGSNVFSVENAASSNPFDCSRAISAVFDVVVWLTTSRHSMLRMSSVKAIWRRQSRMS